MLGKFKIIADMADRLYLSIWFPSFRAPEIVPRLLSVIRQFPFSPQNLAAPGKSPRSISPENVFPPGSSPQDRVPQNQGIGYLAVYSVAWHEPVLFQQTFDYRADPERALALVGEFLHEDNAYELEVLWDLWTPVEEGGLDTTWELRPQKVKILALGGQFEEGACQQDGHIQVDFGLDAPFLYEEVEFTEVVERRIKANVHKLVDFTNAVEKNCGISGRILWSESEDNLAQKLIERLQRVQ